jgi:hypothetical protein
LTIGVWSVTLVEAHPATGTKAKKNSIGRIQEFIAYVLVLTCIARSREATRQSAFLNWGIPTKLIAEKRRY